MRTVLPLLLALLCAALVLVHGAAPCRFAPSFDADAVFSDPATQEEFVQTVAAREANFLLPNPCLPADSSESAQDPQLDLSNIGYHAATGMTLDGHRWTVEEGLPLGEPHLFTAASKESLHLSLLAQALSGIPAAQTFISPSNPANASARALEVLALKINTLDAFFDTFPGFGGFLPSATASSEQQQQRPVGRGGHCSFRSFSVFVSSHDDRWVYVSDAGLTPTADFNSSVPSLDNGQMFWGAYAVAKQLQGAAYRHVLHTPLSLRLSGRAQTSNDELYLSPQTTLAQRWTNMYERMVANALIVFYDARTNSSVGQLRTVSLIVDRSLAIDPALPALQASANYQRVPGQAGPAYLDDPYEGELFTNMAFLFGDWSWTGASSDSVWVLKRAMLQPVGFLVPANADGAGNPALATFLTLEKGYWFSGHEKWKFWMMPYQSSEWSAQVFRAGELARSWSSVINGLPGGFASAAGMAESDTQDTGYVSDCGIAALAWEPVSNKDILTPYAFAALMLASRSHGLSWYHNFLLAPRAQTCFGSLEALNRTGSNFAPLSTWDTKVTTLVAMNGGLGPLVAAALADEPLNAGSYGSGVGGSGTPLPPGLQSAMDLFVWVVDREWSRVFQGLPLGAALDFVRPAAKMPQTLDPWPSCTDDSDTCVCDAAASSSSAAAAKNKVELL